MRVEAALKASAQKRLKQSVVEWIVFLFANLHHCFGALGQSSDLLRQQLVPQLPTQTLGQERSDIAASAAVLPLHRDDFDHSASPIDSYYVAYKEIQPTAASPPPPGSFFFRKNERKNMIPDITARTM